MFGSKKTGQQLTDKQAAFLDALFGEAEGDYKKAMRAAGYSAGMPVIKVIEPLADAIIEKAKLVLAMNAPKAAMGLANVMDKPTSLAARTKIAACERILDRVGIVKQEQVEVTAGEGGGIFILPAKRSQDDDSDDLHTP